MLHMPAPVPEIPVQDLDAAISDYRDLLGFHVDWVEQEIALAGISRGACRLFLAGPGFREGRGNASPLVTWLNLDSVDDVDALYREWHVAGANLTSSPERKPWGLYEFELIDRDRNCVRVFHDVATLERERARAREQGSE